MSGYDEAQIPEILKNYRNVAVVGLSDKSDRDSYRVAKYLMAHGYRIIPVNPAIESWEGIKSYPAVSSIPPDVKVEIVDVFRKPEAALDIVRDSLSRSPKVLWLQEGVVNSDAADLAKENGIRVVMDRCMMKEHNRLKN
jgi:predicted CoA-binding protein